MISAAGMEVYAFSIDDLYHMQHYTMHTLKIWHAKLEQYYLHAEVLEEIQYSGEGEGSDIFQHLSTYHLCVH